VERIVSAISWLEVDVGANLSNLKVVGVGRVVTAYLAVGVVANQAKRILVNVINLNQNRAAI
jgi:hypothetical protein